MRQTAIPYHEDGADLFEAIADHPWAVFLDSGPPHARSGRWDIVTAKPHIRIVTQGDRTLIERDDGDQVSHEDPLELLGRWLDIQPATSPWPFAGGAIGFLAYDLAERLEHVPMQPRRLDTPEMVFGIYDWAVLIDHDLRTCHLLGAGRSDSTNCLWESLVDTFTDIKVRRQPAGYSVVQQAVAETSQEDYSHAFASVRDYIRAGDCYQVNLAQPFHGELNGNRWDAYRQLRLLNPAPFSAYMNMPGCTVLSSSPERFLEVRGETVCTRPIKGTRARYADPILDAAARRALASSEKDRAENLMIVDLLRNDLGKVCRPGTVRVPRLFEIESFANVHHLVSTISGRLAPGKNALDLLRAAFPGGSITGAPKRRAMEIIAELEPKRRGLYCGAIGYIGYNGDMDTNIAIRTLSDDGQSVNFWAGGGLVADSNMAEEYQECLDKAAPLLRLLRPIAE